MYDACSEDCNMVIACVFVCVESSVNVTSREEFIKIYSRE